MQVFRQPAYILPILVFLLTISCAAKITRLYHDESFTYQSIVSSKIAVGSVTSIVNDLTAEREKKYSSLLAARLKAVRKDFSFSKEEDILKALGDDERKKIVDEYKNSGELSGSSIEILKNRISVARYLVFARIEDNDYWGRLTRSSIYDYEDSYYPGGRPVRVFVGLDSRYRTYRGMTVSMRVYDINAGKLAWGGTLTDYMRNMNRDRHRWGYWHSTYFSYPKPPKSEEILRFIFDSFAKNFPGLEKKK